MYKIYINGTPLFLLERSAFLDLCIKSSKDTLCDAFLGGRKTIKQYHDLLEKNTDFKGIYLYSDDLNNLWEVFQDCYKVIEAAGGFVENEEEKALIFYRRGSWDMPKGKIDKGETTEEAAIREVQEETGLQNLILGPLLVVTYHTYREKGKRILKKTYWYKMKTGDTVLIPQTEEGITEILWATRGDIQEKFPLFYPNIQDVFQTVL